MSEPRVFPKVLEAERALLGAAMRDSETLDLPLRALDFYAPHHQALWELFLRMVQDKEPIDALTVPERMVADQQVKRCGGIGYVVSLGDRAFGTVNIRHYATMVVEASKKRVLMQECLALVDEVESIDAGQMALRLEQVALGVQSRSDSGLRTLGEGASEALSDLRSGKGRGISTGLYALDGYTKGLLPADLWVVGGRPSMGKSALGQQIAESVAQAGVPALFISQEMQNKSLGLRALRRDTEIEPTRLDEPSPEVMRVMQIHYEKLKHWPFYVDDRARVSLAQIRALVLSAAKTKGVKVVVVDFIQLCKVSGDNRAQGLTDISNGLKRLAKDAKVTVIALAQANRQSLARKDKRPMLGEMKDSSGIEEAADVVLFVHREHWFNPNADPGLAELVIAKNRNGPTGIIHTRWSGAHASFNDI